MALKHQFRHLNRQVIGGAMIVGIIGGIVIDIMGAPVVYVREVEAAIPVVVEPQEVRIKLVYNWTQERIIEEIHNVFPDAPIMERVAKCEGIKNGKLDPDVVNPTNDSYDTGIFQISMLYHGDRIKAMGLDMTDVIDNLHFARILYDESGLQPWEASRHCWMRAHYGRIKGVEHHTEKTVIIGGLFLSDRNLLCCASKERNQPY
jgi:hypothetical protein